MVAGPPHARDLRQLARSARSPMRDTRCIPGATRPVVAVRAGSYRGAGWSQGLLVAASLAGGVASEAIVVERPAGSGTLAMAEPTAVSSRCSASIPTRRPKCAR